MCCMVQTVATHVCCSTCWLCCCQVRTFIDGAYQRTVALLREKKELVDAMAQVRGGSHMTSE